jgi:hypothetical protein
LDGLLVEVCRLLTLLLLVEVVVAQELVVEVVLAVF